MLRCDTGIIQVKLYLDCGAFYNFTVTVKNGQAIAVTEVTS
jgi:hypothetical protein